MAKKAKLSTATELRRTKRELAVMRARYFDLYDLAPVGIFTLSKAGLILEANHTVTTLLGVKKPLLLKHPLKGFIHPEDRRLFSRHIKASETEKTLPALLLRMRRGDSAPFWARLEMTRGHDGDGAFFYRGVLSDVSEHMKTRLDLLRLRAAVDNAHDGIAVADMDGRLQFANQAWAKMHGYAADELLGKPLSIGHTKEQLENDVVPFNKKVLDRGSWTGEVGHVRKDGKTFQTWMSTVLLRGADGKPTGLVGMADDITERRKADEYLARVLSEREAILKSIPDLFYRLDADMNLADWNQVFEFVSGYSPGELRGMNALEFFDADKKLVGEGIEEALLKGQAYRTAKLLTRRGEEVPVFWSAAALRDSDGRLLGLVGIGRDLTAK